jgi:hypothetical protein
MPGRISPWRTYIQGYMNGTRFFCRPGMLLATARSQRITLQADNAAGLPERRLATPAAREKGFGYPSRRVIRLSVTVTRIICDIAVAASLRPCRDLARSGPGYVYDLYTCGARFSFL